jgi:IS5 family transposase
VSGSPEQIGQDGDVRGPLGEDQTVSSAGERSQDVDEHLLAGRPANRTHQVLADKGYSSKANRAYLRRRGIHATIPERRDQQANRARRGSAAGTAWGGRYGSVRFTG